MAATANGPDSGQLTLDEAFALAREAAASEAEAGGDPGEQSDVPALRLPETQNWGESFHRAWRQARQHFGPGGITYRAIADRVSLAVPVTDTTILRLRDIRDIRESPARTKQTAYLALIAIGFDPRHFHLTHEDRRLRGITDRQLRAYLDPHGAGAA